MQAHDPLEEVDLGDGAIRWITYISTEIDNKMNDQVIELLKEFRDCFVWDYNEMPGLSREMVEIKLPISPGKRPVKQMLRRFAPEVLSKIKVEIEQLLKIKFIKTSRYVESLSNIVPVVKKNRALRICIDFRDLNKATPKEEYPMLVAEMLIDSAAGINI